MSKTMFSALAALAMTLAGCATAPPTEAKRDALQDESRASLREMASRDGKIQDLVNNSYGYVIFPSIGKGGAIVGGAFGRGIVYEQGRPVGFAELEQGSVGAQIGGESYSELVVFENRDALDRVKASHFDLGANASAVVVKAGVGAEGRFEHGLRVFVLPRGGLMADASINGQKINYAPMTAEQAREAGMNMSGDSGSRSETTTTTRDRY